MYPPLISEQYIDAGSQRLYAIGIFVLIQAVKLYELFQIHYENKLDMELAFAFKYMVIEGLYLFLLPVFRIPWLTFTPATTVILIIGCSITTIALSAASTFPLAATLSAIGRALYDRELSITEHRVRAKDVVHGSDHISGRHVVHILPESTAKLNPYGDVFCLDRTTSTPAYVPMRLNATEPGAVQLYHVNFDDSSYELLNFTKRELRKWTEFVSSESVGSAEAGARAQNSKIYDIKLPLSKPGLYRLAKVSDTANLNVKIHPADVVLSYCPSAAIRGGTSPSNSAGLAQDRCIGALETPELVIDGVPPLRIKYSRSIQGRDLMFAVQSIQPDRFSSPLLQGRLPRDGKVWHAGETLEWANAEKVKISLDTALNQVGRWAYMIDEVEDGLGNLVNYSKIFENKDREESPLLAKKGLNYGFLVHPRPSIRYVSCDPEKPVNLAKGKAANVPLQLSGTLDEGPYQVLLQYQPLDESDEDGDTGKVVAAPRQLELNMRNGMERLRIDKPGTYTIQSVKGKFCDGDVLESASCLALTPAEPTVSVKFEDIEDKCVGSIGVTADLTLTGTPPFRLQYQVITNRQHVKTEYLTIENTRHQLQFRPEKAGHYTYEFYMLSDNLYQNIQLDRSQFRTEQTVKVLATAGFAPRSLSSRCCTGDSAELDVDLHGTGPFTLTYETVHGNKRTQHVIPDITGERYRLTTPPLTKGGTYVVALLSVEDGNGCRRALSEADAHVEVRRQRPAAQFGAIDGRMNVKGLMGQKVQIPLRLTGEAPWSITYVHKNASGGAESSTTVMKHRPNGEYITVSDEGLYEITDVRDAYCPGDSTASSKSAFEVSWFDRPSLELVASERLAFKEARYAVSKDVCEGEEDALEIALYGAPPFSVLYEREYIPSPGESGSSSSLLSTTSGSKPVKFDLQAATKYANIQMETSKYGRYRYTLRGVSDSVYEDKSLLAAFEPVVVEQTVHRRPEASFVNPGTTYRSCWKAEVEDSSIEPIKLRFSGVAPFAVTLEVKHENEGQSETVTISNIREKVYSLRSIYAGLGLGKHVITIAHVRDGRGCTRSKQEHVTVMVADVATIVASSPREDYCVGERVSFVLTGVPPFEVEYEFNGKRQRATTHSPFSRLASSAGNFTITSVKDSASTCKVNLSEKLTKVIHEVPTVKVSEGTSIVSDIHEGDRAEIVFTLEGAAPFAFTYTRSERAGHNKYRVVETHTVTDVYEDSYSIFTSMEGVYEAISIEDRYCRARIGS
ncbi:hypothetical protein BZA70DRAFT_233542 [Myxozyma melibiosi]|uniref:Nucleoporin n=1 Tax=Myxozyma melibiosi TaxID=54550 RepID=A0ABR1FC99_9ASCO